MSSTPPPPPGAPPPPGQYPQPDPYRQPGAPNPSRGGNKAALIAIAVVVALMIAGGVVLFAMSGGDDDSPPELSRSELESGLLTADDAGDGFAEQEDDDEDILSGDDVTASEECTSLLDDLSSFDTSGVNVSSAFQSPDALNTVEHTILLPDDDAPGIDQIDELLATCAEFDYDDGESAGTVQMTEGDEISVGSDSRVIALELQVTSPIEVTARGTSVFWEDGGLRVSVSAVSLDGDVDGDEVRRLVERADEKVRALLEEAD